jgi:serine/threonine-protein kinase
MADEPLFGKFEIRETLKKDEFSSVYVAEHVYLGRRVLLKILDTQSAPDPSMVERFKREAKILSRLNHPNIVKVYDFSFHENFCYFATEFIESQNLRQYVDSRELSEREVVSLLGQLFDALGFAHRSGVVHRDLKPENLLVDEAGDLKIVDFGLAQIESERHVTQATSVVGTPAYMSPEQARGEELTYKSDLFSAGALAHELWFGENPFDKGNVGATLNALLNGEEDIFEREPPEDKPVDRLIYLLLKRDPDERLESAEEATRMLGYESQAPRGGAATPSEMIREKATPAIYAFAILAAIAVAFWVDPFAESPKEPEVPEGPVALSDSASAATPEPTETTRAETPDDLAPTDVAADESDANASATVFIECSPWAYVEIDGEFYDSTPIKGGVTLPPGERRLTLSHPDYPDVTRTIRLRPGETRRLRYTLDEMIAEIVVRAHPWGEVYVDGVRRGETPLAEPIRVDAGTRVVEIRHPDHPTHSKTLSLKPGDRVVVERNFLDR